MRNSLVRCQVECVLNEHTHCHGRRHRDEGKSNLTSSSAGTAADMHTYAYAISVDLILLASHQLAQRITVDTEIMRAGCHSFSMAWVVTLCTTRVMEGWP